MSVDALKVFSRLHGFEAPEGIYAVYIPERGWCRNLKYISAHDYYWTKKFRTAHICHNPKTLARWLNTCQIPNDPKVVNVLTLKTWSVKDFVTEFQHQPKKWKRQRKQCPRCTRTVSLVKSGKQMKHWCPCRKCYKQPAGMYNGTNYPGCLPTCANAGL